METLSVSGVSAVWRAQCGRGLGAVPPMRSTHPKGQKFGAKRQMHNPMGEKRSVFPTAGKTQYGGITQNLSTSGTPRYYTHRYKPHNNLSAYKLITTVYKSCALYLYLPHGYRNIITFSRGFTFRGGVF
jgi:hypothetical protein